MVAECPAETAPFGGVGENVNLKLTTRAWKTIKKVRPNTHFFIHGSLTRFVFVQCGGRDNYLLSTKMDLLGQEGMRLRILVQERRGLKALENPKEVTRAL
jgi:hypothetical protein